MLTNDCYLPFDRTISLRPDHHLKASTFQSFMYDTSRSVFKPHHPAPFPHDSALKIITIPEDQTSPYQVPPQFPFLLEQELVDEEGG